jgi:hypothetical protein
MSRHRGRRISTNCRSCSELFIIAWPEDPENCDEPRSFASASRSSIDAHAVSASHHSNVPASGLLGCYELPAYLHSGLVPYGLFSIYAGSVSTGAWGSCGWISRDEMFLAAPLICFAEQWRRNSTLGGCFVSRSNFEENVFSAGLSAKNEREGKSRWWKLRRTLGWR